MGRKKIAPFFMYFLTRKEELRAQGKTPTEDALSELVSAEWKAMSVEQKQSYRGIAESEKGKQRFARYGAILSSSCEPGMLSLGQRMSAMVAKFLAVEVGAPRTEVMRFEFVSCCISPIFIGNRQNHKEAGFNGGSLQECSPIEICLVRWNIVFGIKQVYHIVYGVQQIPNKANTIAAVPVVHPESGKLCTDLDVIAAEVDDFMGDANRVLIRGYCNEHVSACLSDLFRYNDQVVRTTPIVLDTIVLLRQMLINETKGREVVPYYKQLKEKFEKRSACARFEDGVNRGIGVDCWHANHQFCAARRAVDDVFVLLGELGPAFQARMLQGSHVPMPGKLLPRKYHCCGNLNQPKRLGQSEANQCDLRLESSVDNPEWSNGQSAEPGNGDDTWTTHREDGYQKFYPEHSPTFLANGYSPAGDSGAAEVPEHGASEHPVAWGTAEQFQPQLPWAGGLPEESLTEPNGYLPQVAGHPQRESRTQSGRTLETNVGQMNTRETAGQFALGHTSSTEIPEWGSEFVLVDQHGHNTYGDVCAKLTQTSAAPMKTFQVQPAEPTSAPTEIDFRRLNAKHSQQSQGDQYSNTGNCVQPRVTMRTDQYQLPPSPASTIRSPLPQIASPSFVSKDARPLSISTSAIRAPRGRTVRAGQAFW